MKRFDLFGFGIVVGVGTLSSCAQVGQFTHEQAAADVQLSRTEVPVEPLQTLRVSPADSELPGSTKEARGAKDLPLSTLFARETPDPEKSPSISLDKTVAAQSANTVQNSDTVSNTGVTQIADAPSTIGRSKAAAELVQTAFVQKLQLDVPPAPLEDGDALELEAVPLLQAGRLTLGDLEQMALESNPTLQQAAAVVAKARGIHLQVGLYPNPTIGYIGTEMGDSNTAGQQGGFVGQTIVTGNKLRLNQAVADWSIEAVSWEYQAQRYRVLNDVRLRYFDVLGSQRRVSIGEDLVRVAETGVKTAKDLFEAKQGAKPDVLQAQVDLNAVRIVLQNARYDLEAAWKQLASVLGQPDLAQAQLAGTLQKDMPTYEWEVTYAKLLEDSPVIQAANSRVQRAITQIRRQEVQPIPNLQTQVGGAHDYLSGFDEVNVQVGISLPIFNRNQGNIAIAQAEYLRAVRDVERLQLSLRNQLAAALRDYQQAYQQVERYQQDILPNAKENLSLTEEGYKQGEFDFLRVLTARRTYFETNLQNVNSQIAVRQADVVLSGLLLTGGLNGATDIGVGASILGGVGQRGQALGGQ